MIEVVFTDMAIDDLRKLGPDAVPKVLEKVSSCWIHRWPVIHSAAN
ncbi:hypothetical protein [Nocardia sp.]|nr:hypothetical protein [Nocardia sp.]